MISLRNVMTARIGGTRCGYWLLLNQISRRTFVCPASTFCSPKRSARANSGTMTTPPPAPAESI